MGSLLPPCEFQTASPALSKNGYLRTMDLQDLQSSIRKAAAEHLWSAGVRLYRAGRVVFESEDDEELKFSVTNPGRVALSVYLWPQYQDWGCDCGREICIHAVAVSIAATRRARGEDDAGWYSPGFAVKEITTTIRVSTRRKLPMELATRIEVRHEG